VFLTISQTRLLLVAIGVVAALVLAFDLAHMSGRSQTSQQPATYTGIARNTPGSTAHLRAAFRTALLHRAAAKAV
jgi:hypothetical protein